MMPGTGLSCTLGSLPPGGETASGKLAPPPPGDEDNPGYLAPTLGSLPPGGEAASGQLASRG